MLGRRALRADGACLHCKQNVQAGRVLPSSAPVASHTRLAKVVSLFGQPVA